MPKLKRHATVSVARLQLGHLRSSAWDRRDPRQLGCVFAECLDPVIETCPVALCGKHLREVYEFAQDFIASRWDGAVREYVSELHSTFKPPRAVTKRKRPGHVYFIRLGDRIKIGYSENPAARLAELPHEEVLGVIRGSRDDERAWHNLLADYRTTGEWFRADPVVLDAVMQVCSACPTEDAS